MTMPKFKRPSGKNFVLARGIASKMRGENSCWKQGRGFGKMTCQNFDFKQQKGDEFLWLRNSNASNMCLFKVDRSNKICLASNLLNDAKKYFESKVLSINRSWN
jgi:hypothetical protein